jgi:tetratricopeptide (TPR) repeat protein
MKRIFLIHLMMLLAAVTGAMASPFDEANRQFAAGEFTAAAASYEKFIAESGPDASAYYNLGNSYQSLKKYGPAIVAYERARLLTPRDPDLLANLALARKAATLFEDTGMNPRVAAVVDYLSRNEWSWLVAGGALVLGMLAMLHGVVKFRVRWKQLLGLGGAILAGIGIGVGSVALFLRSEDASRGIVLSENATIRISPFEKADALGTAGTGRTVRLGEKSGVFRYVRVPGTNLQGWLADAEVAAIDPDGSGS